MAWALRGLVDCPDKDAHGTKPKLDIPWEDRCAAREHLKGIPGAAGLLALERNLLTELGELEEER